MPIETARKLVKRLLASYPNLVAHDPEGYFAEMIEVMSQYPEWAGQRAIAKVDEENADFAPPVPKLRKWLDDAVRPYRFTQEWNARSQKQIGERLPEDGSRPEPVSGGGKVFSNFDDAVAAHGRPSGAFEAGRQIPYRGGSE